MARGKFGIGSSSSSRMAHSAASEHDRCGLLIWLVLFALGYIADRVRGVGQMMRATFQRCSPAKGICLTDTRRHPRSVEMEGISVVELQCDSQFKHLQADLRPALSPAAISSERELSYLRELAGGEELSHDETTTAKREHR